MMDLFLASGSFIRAEMLRNVGVDFIIHKPDLDEEPIKKRLLDANAYPHEIAEALARAKALSVSCIKPYGYVLGADQVLSFEGGIISKAQNMNEARQCLKMLSEKKHMLISAVAIAHENKIIWQAVDKVELTMRPLTDHFIDFYLKDCGNTILQSVGCYQLEGKGAQLFDHIKGDYFTVLGMPLLKVLHFCRTYGLLIA